MFKVSDITRRDIININDGAKLGALKDMHIDPVTGTIKAFVLQGPKKYGLLSVGRDVLIPWEKIKKIGVHTVLVDVESVHSLQNY